MTALVPIMDRRAAVQFDGSNQAAIAALFDPGDFEIVSVVGGVLSFKYQAVPRTVATGGWVTTANGGHVNNTYNAADFADMLALIPVADPPAVSAVGSKAVPSVLLNQSANVDIDLSRTMADTSYAVSAYLVGAVGSLTVTSAAALDANTVRVVVHAGLAYVSGAQLVVVVHGVV